MVKKGIGNRALLVTIGIAFGVAISAFIVGFIPRNIIEWSVFIIFVTIMISSIVFGV